MSMECEVEYIREIRNDQGKHTTTLVLGRIRVFHIRKDMIHQKLEPLMHQRRSPSLVSEDCNTLAPRSATNLNDPSGTS